VGALAAVATVASPSTAVADELAPAVAVAASPSQIARKPCADAWNSKRNMRWQAYATRLGSKRAFVSVAGTTVRTEPKKTHQGCVVKLWLDWRPGHFQAAVVIDGALRGGRIEFGFRSFPPATAFPQRLRQRTTIQYANSRVLPNGTLDYAGVSIP